MTRFSRTLAFFIPAAFAFSLHADNASYTNTGGTMTLGSSFEVASSAVASPAGILSINCPITSIGAGTYSIVYNCSGGSLSFASTDGSTTVSAAFTSGALSFSGSGGGRGGNVKYYYQFSGNFSGVITRNGVSEAINGGTNQSVGPLTAQIGSGSAHVNGGSTGLSSAYAPFYFTNGTQILRTSDTLGTDLVAYGASGSGAGQFSQSSGIALDSLGRIYIADSYNYRVVRIDDITGKNWTTLGTYGSGVNQFSLPSAIAIDSTGRIYVADSYNNRVVRFDDMTGKNWVAYGSGGTGTGQFSDPQSIAVDAADHIYIADTSNNRIVKIDDMTGTNWTTLTQSPVIGIYIYLIQNPLAVAVDPLGRIYFGETSTVVGSSITRVDNMTGANWTSINTGNNMTGLSVDGSGTVFSSGATLAVVESFSVSASLSTTFGYTYGIAPIPVPSPVPPAVRVSTKSLTYANQNTHTASVPQTLTLTNFGGSPLALSSIKTSGDFSETSTCGVSLPGGESCTTTVTFSPTVTGVRTGALTISDNSNNAGASQAVSLTGTGTAPVLAAAPSALTFEAQVVKTKSAAQYIILSNTGTGPLSVENVVVTGDFAQSNNCGATVSPGTSCTISVTFTPTATGTRTGVLALTDTTGTQNFTLTGTGTMVAPTVTVSPASLIFPGQLLNNTSAPQTVTLSNTGAAAISVTSVSITGDYTEASTCPASLKAKTSCTIKVAFKPVASGVRSGTLTLKLSSGTLTVGLSGTGASSSTPPSLTTSVSSFDFGGYVPGDNPSQAITVTNTNGVTAGIAGISLTGSSTFTQTNTCGSVLSAGASCSVVITFQPVAYGPVSATLTVTESSGFVHQVPITGTGVTDGSGS